MMIAPAPFSDGTLSNSEIADQFINSLKYQEHEQNQRIDELVRYILLVSRL